LSANPHGAQEILRRRSFEAVIGKDRNGGPQGRVAIEFFMPSHER
jgi:hypothetical protein